MNKLITSVIAVVSTVLASPVTLASASTSTDAASDYFDANWAVFNTGRQPHLPATRVYEEISNRYFDANWSLINNKGRTHPASTAIHADHDMKPEPGEE